MAISGRNMQLITPTTKYLDSFRELITDLALHGLLQVSDPEVDATDSRLKDHIMSLESGHYWWLVGDQLAGRIQLRKPTEGGYFETHGDVGYEISPRFQNQGNATKMLGALLAEAKILGRKQLMISCHISNAASMRVIEKNGGVFRDIFADEFRRYDFELR